MDVSFLIPTNRPHLIDKTIQSINNLDMRGLEYEICVYSQTSVSGKNVRWIPEGLAKGPIFAFNMLAYMSLGKYMAILTDDCSLPNPQTINLMISAFNSPLFENRKMKILGFSSGIPVYTPGQGSRFGSLFSIPQYIERHPVARFPFLSRDTFDNYLQQHVFHPEFRYHAADNWLGWWLGFKGEPFIEYSPARIVHHSEHGKNHEFEIVDCNTAYMLVLNYLNGLEDYILPEHAAYSRSIAPRKMINKWT